VSSADRAGSDDRVAIGHAVTPATPSATPVSLRWTSLEVSPAARARLASALSAGERTRAERLIRTVDRERFVTAHGWLRGLLARELGCAPSRVPIVVEPGGKPRIDGSELRFNLAHSAGVALLAGRWGAEVGVDVEAIRDEVAVAAVAARLFSASEQRMLRSLAPAERRRAFFGCWTRHEAYVKATGAGLGAADESLSVWAGDRGPVTVSGWTVHEIELEPGFAAAVAGPGLDETDVSAPRHACAENSSSFAE
jgi:4'-phosphopantetheinyl transferase